MTSTVKTLPGRPLVRLRLAPSGPTPRRIDGAWWPHSADLMNELPELLAALPAAWGQIATVSVSGALWRTIPGRMLVANRVVNLRTAPTSPFDAPTICLLSPGNGRWDLRVIPPETVESEAESLMDTAVTRAA